MTQKNKNQKGVRKRGIEHKSGKITKIIKLDYIAELICWCGNSITIDSSKPMNDNTCHECGSPYKLLNEEWTGEEIKNFTKFMKERENQ